jgi:hypothetical protein
MSKTYSLKKQIPRDVALVVADELVRALADTVIVGSLRRGCDVVGDIDLLMTNPAAAPRGCALSTALTGSTT